MKRINFISLLLIILILSACQNFDINHPDYKYTAGYFPYQFPVRTLVLGDYIYDNTNDNAHKFEVFVAMGGVYENKQDRVFNITVDNSLCNNILFRAGGDRIQALSSNYYTLASNQITIPKGKINGSVEVQLNDAFFNDPLAIRNTYVLPLRLVSSNDVDTILVGSSPNPNADPRIASQWTIAPKNFTMYAVKYINEYHGNYFHYGNSVVKDAAGASIEQTSYSEQYVEKNTVVKLATTASKQASLTKTFESKVMTGTYTLLLDFNGNAITVTAPEGAAYTVTGAGEFKAKAYNWGNKERDGLTLKYTLKRGNNTYEADETLVIRDRGVVMEVYTPVLL